MKKPSFCGWPHIQDNLGSTNWTKVVTFQNTGQMEGICEIYRQGEETEDSDW